MIVRDATDEDFAHVVRHMRAEDAFEIYSGRFDKSEEALLADLRAARSCALCLLALCQDDGRPVTIVGVLLVAPARAALMMFSTGEFPKIARAATRFFIRKATPAYLGGLRSADCYCWDGKPVGRWLEALGFQRVGMLEQYDEHGSTFLLYRWVNPRFSEARKL